MHWPAHAACQARRGRPQASPAAGAGLHLAPRAPQAQGDPSVAIPRLFRHRWRRLQEVGALDGGVWCCGGVVEVEWSGWVERRRSTSRDCGRGAGAARVEGGRRPCAARAGDCFFFTAAPLPQKRNTSPPQRLPPDPEHPKKASSSRGPAVIWRPAAPGGLRSHGGAAGGARGARRLRGRQGRRGGGCGAARRRRRRRAARAAPRRAAACRPPPQLAACAAGRGGAVRQLRGTRAARRRAGDVAPQIRRAAGALQGPRGDRHSRAPRPGAPRPPQDIPPNQTIYVHNLYEKLNKQGEPAAGCGRSGRSAD
jgi:hypothetical protein